LVLPFNLDQSTDISSLIDIARIILYKVARF